jgi:homoserine trans-succinylase
MSKINPIDLPKEDVLPVLPAAEELRNQIMKQQDAVQILIRPLNNNIDSLFSEEIIESKSMNKKVRTTYLYREVEINGKTARVGNGTITEEIS